MHHFQHPDGYINFKSDLSGEVHIVNSRGEELQVSGLMLVNFVATYVEEYMLPGMREAQARIEATGVASLGPTTPEGGGSS